MIEEEKIKKYPKLSYVYDKILAMSDCLDRYADKCREKKRPYYNEKVRTIIYKDIMKEIFRQIIFEGKTWKLPYTLGYIRVAKSKVNINMLTVDPYMSIKTGSKVYYMNDHTNGFKFFFIWKKHENIHNKVKYFRFYPSRTIKSDLNKAIVVNKMDYFPLQDFENMYKKKTDE